MDAADAEDDLLLDPHLVIAPVELCGDVAILRRVLRPARVEQVERDAPDRELPHAHAHPAVQDFDTEREVLLLRIEHGLHGEVREILVQREAVLPALLVDLLLEVPVPVQQRDRHEGQVQIARRLAMVAREDAEAARVIRERLVKAELRREIRHGAAERRSLVRLSPRVLARHVGVELLQHGLHLAQEIIAPRELFEPRLAAELEHPHGVVVRRVPDHRIDLAEERPRRRLPRPPQVERQPPHRFEIGREFRNDVIRVDRLHVSLSLVAVFRTSVRGKGTAPDAIGPCDEGKKLSAADKFRSGATPSADGSAPPDTNRSCGAPRAAPRRVRARAAGIFRRRGCGS